MDTAAEAPPYLYMRISDHIAAAIDAGAIPIGGRLPSLRAISRRFDCSVSTALQAYAELERAGRCRSVEKSGYFAASPLTGAVPAPETERYSLSPEEVRPVSILGRIVEASNEPGIVPLGAGIPDAALLPGPAVERALIRTARNRPDLLRGYSDEAGNRELRGAAARILLRRGVVAEADEILITNGCMEALGIALETVTRPGDAVVIECPVFPGTLQLLERLGRRVIPLPTSSSEGINLSALETVLRSGAAAAAVLTALYQNPLGFVMPEENREKAVELCRRFEIPLVEDDVYGETSFEHAEPRSLKSFDRHGNVIYCSSISKTVGPGLRAGWLSGGRYHRDCRTLKMARTLGGSSLLQAAAGEYLASPAYARQVKRLQTAIARQAREMRQLLLETLPVGSALSDPKGGYYLWVELPGNPDALRLFERALAGGISVVPGPAFSPGERYANCIRVTYGSPLTENIRDGIRRLAAMIGEMR